MIEMLRRQIHEQKKQRQAYMALQCEQLSDQRKQTQEQCEQLIQSLQLIYKVNGTDRPSEIPNTQVHHSIQPFSPFHPSKKLWNNYYLCFQTFAKAYLVSEKKTAHVFLVISK